MTVSDERPQGLIEGSGRAGQPVKMKLPIWLSIGEPGPPRAAIVISDGGNTTALTMPEIKIEHERGGQVRAAYTDADGEWSATSDSAQGAIIALLATRAGYVADVKMMWEPEGV